MSARTETFSETIGLKGLGNALKTGLLLAAMTALILVIGQAIGGGKGLAIAGAFAVVSNFVAFWFSDKLALAVHGARPVPVEEAPWLHEMVERIAQRAGVPKPAVYLIPSPAPNAFATGRSPARSAVAVTSGLVQLLSRRELAGVVAHEIAHVANRDTLVATIAATIAGAVSGVASMLQWAAIFGGVSRDEEEEGAGGGGLIGMLALIILAPLTATVLQLAISRSREYGADEAGAKYVDDPEALASALEKLERGAELLPDDRHPATASLFIVNPLSGRTLMRWFSTHPPIEERVRRLRELR